MNTTSVQRLNMLQDIPSVQVSEGRLIGLEKESLRVQKDGGIAQTDHPVILGAALTNPHITTDYSEALLEIVTPPMASGADAISFLDDAHRFLYPRLSEEETIWATSMPCVLNGDESIRVGYYGDSNAGKMKHVYRRGLGRRYGKSMQAIAGVHFNYSLPATFWKSWHEACGSPLERDDFITEQYFHMTRNLLRLGWLVPYLFGASPAICKSFLNGQPQLPTMKNFGGHTCYEPFGTSLRMGDVGYVYSEDESTEKIRVSYNNLNEYVSDLLGLISQPDPRYAKIGLKDASGKYQQLNVNRLQIENEYYSSVRPKQIAHADEMPLLAMARRGIRYLELRSIDVNVFEPVGVSEEQVCFLEILMLHSLWNNSPDIDKTCLDSISENMSRTAHQGRNPDLKLFRSGLKREIALKDWGLELMDEMLPTAGYLDRSDDTKKYTDALARQRSSVVDPELTPSARVLREMHGKHNSFYGFARHWSLKHAREFQDGLSPNDDLFESAARDSVQKQQGIEAKAQDSFEQYLRNYFAQLESPELTTFSRARTKLEDKSDQSSLAFTLEGADSTLPSTQS